jgi:hypothetical protein
MSVTSDVEEESKQKEEHREVDTNPVLSAESRLDKLLLNSGESKPGPERDEKTPVTESKGRADLSTDLYTVSRRAFKYHGQYV